MLAAGGRWLFTGSLAPVQALIIPPKDNDQITVLFGKVPPPLGYDLAAFFGNVDNPAYGVLRLTPWRVELANLFEPQQVKVWKA
jgi:hypothetical protein